MAKAIITSDLRDLHYGEVTVDAIAAVPITHAITVSECRHIGYWHGPTGGLTSLAVEGPDQESRIGAPCESLLTHVVNIHICTPEAVARFAAVKP